MTIPGMGTESNWYDCSTREVFTEEKRIWCDRLLKLQNATYIVPSSYTENPEYISVTLKNGEYQPNDDGQMFVTLVNERNWLTFGDIDGDGKIDAAVIFGVVPYGTALTTYLSVVLDIDGAAQAITPVALGERIMLNGPIVISNGGVRVSRLTATEVLEEFYSFSDSNLLKLEESP
ncbi:hypothetical protein [Gloeocapsa sp. PCC 73106]|uniref:hypothetical protein n=1 Tax=Gloeocapsa sp. PCC 73106 TaxID=102232 RepID=UPI001181B614|nr:hypothetical protein [Gloeocapsa sp. PCC 73106]